MCIHFFNDPQTSNHWRIGRHVQGTQNNSRHKTSGAWIHYKVRSVGSTL